MICSLRSAALVLFLGLQLSSEAYAAALAEPGPRPQYDESLCARAASPGSTWKARTSDEKALEALIEPIKSAHANRLISLAGDEVMWDIRAFGEISISTVPTGIHEANHIVDFLLSACNGQRATYVFAGQTYVTDLVRGSTPPYRIAAEKIPASIKARQLGRYAPYFERTRPLPGDDITTLMDEFNAYAGGAQLEIDLAATPLYREIAGAFDGNIGGTADFMLYTLCYLKAVNEKDPRAYQRIKQSPLFVAHLQRLWADAERVLAAAQPYLQKRGGLYQLDQETLDVIYSEAYIAELDKLSVRHLRQQPGA